MDENKAPAQNQQDTPGKNEAGLRRGSHFTMVEREKIKGKITEMLAAGIPPKRIMAEVEVSEPTYYRYIKQIGMETMDKRIKDTSTLIHNYFTRTERLIRKLELKYESTGDLRVLAENNRIVQETFDRMQSAGFLPKAKEKVELSGKVEIPSVKFKVPIEMK